MKKINILHIEDSPEIILIVKKALGEIATIHSCHRFSDIERIINEIEFDIMLIDLMLPAMSGHELLSFLREHKNTTHAYPIIVSSKNDVFTKILSYQLGALNYIEKPFDIKLLRSIIKASISFIRNRPDQSYQSSKFIVDKSYLQVRSNDLTVTLTSAEFRIFSFMLDRVGRIISRDEIIQSYSNSSSGQSDRTVDAHISSLRKKLKVFDVDFKSVYGEGYKLLINDDENHGLSA